MSINWVKAACWFVGFVVSGVIAEKGFNTVLDKLDEE